jgi:methionyl-tRNA formyltransferase
MDLVFFGSGAFGLPTLEALAGAHRVAGVVTQPDRPAGRGKSLAPTPIGTWAAAHLAGVPMWKPERVNAPDVLSEIRDISADVWVVIAFGQKLSAALLDGRFAINLHASLLPRWRGAAPINAAILAGDERTGNSVIALAERMDAGLVLGQSTRPIEPEQTAGDLHDLLAADGPALVMQVLDDKAAGKLDAREQDESKVTIAPKLSAADRWVDFREPAPNCRRRIHGLTPWPGVSVQAGSARLKLSRVEVVDVQAEPDQVGTLVDAAKGIVACGGASGLRLIEVQPEGKRAMSWEDYARGHQPAVGTKFDGGRAPC